MTDADKELREIEAENMRKLGRKTKPLLNGWITRKRMIAEAFAKLPFVVKADGLFARVDLAVYLKSVEKSYTDPGLDSNFGMVDCTQGSGVVTFTGKRPELIIGGTFAIKDDIFTVKSFNATSVTLDVYGNGQPTFARTSGSYKAVYQEEGKVDRYRIIPEEKRPPLHTTIMSPITASGRLW